MISRKNVLELIGRNRGKYHSCILTCYSLDFSFFEERVLPTLRLASIKNVNVFADGHYLEQAQEITTGKEFKHNKTYNFQPIYETGVFHPKIMLLTGVKHGLLIIGSGNITSSGLSTNDEIWGAFQLDNVGNDNAPLFGAVWNYLQPYLNQSLGFVPQKIDWMRKQSPWLAELPISNDWVKLEEMDTKLKFIANTKEQSTFSQLVANVPNTAVEELTIISPYFDKSGKQLKQLHSHFSPTHLKCLVDEDSGLLPTQLDEAVSDQIGFYNWADCKSDYESNYNRLHAKLINFRCKDEEYLLLGSANITMAAMGMSDGTAANGEAGILIKRNGSNKNWVEELGIKIPNNAIQLKESSRQGIENNTIARINYKYRILYAELRGNEVTIYLNKVIQDTPITSVFDRLDINIENQLIQKNEDTLVISVADPDSTFKVSIINDADERISNFCLVHRLDALLRCNPDPQQEKLDALLEQDFTDGEGITDLLQYVDFNWADDEIKSPIRVSNNASSPITLASEDDQTKEYKILKAEEFNKISLEAMLRQNGELSNATVKIAEFLSIYTSGAFTKDDDFQESEEQKLFEDEAQEGSGGEAKNTRPTRTNGAKEKKALDTYFYKLNEVYSKRLKPLQATGVLTEAPDKLITIRSLSSILIALQLIQKKNGKKYTEVTSSIDESGNALTKEYSFIYSGSIGDSVDTIKGFLLNVLGKFLLLATAGSKTYEFEILNQKLSNSQTQLLVNSTCLILNTPWKESEKDERDMLLLNCLHFSGSNILLNDKDGTELIDKLNTYMANAAYTIPEFKDQLKHFTDILLSDYLAWLKIYVNKKESKKMLLVNTSDLTFDDIIFSSTIGFNKVKKVSLENEKFRIDLSRPGYDFDGQRFALNKVRYGTKSITYRIPEAIELAKP